MYELVQVGENSYYIQCPAKIGVVLINESTVCLIDSGNDKDAGKKVLKHIEAQGWKVNCILNTHSHADHIGGNQLIQNRTGCRIFARGMEVDFTQHPVLESCFLYGGCSPKELRHKFLMAQESRAEALTDETLPEGLKMIPLPGHCFDMVGFQTKDNVVYLADCVSSKVILEKYPISYLFDVGQSLETLRYVSELKAAMFVPSHTDAIEDIRPLAELNIKKIMGVGDIITDLCQDAVPFDILLQKIFTVFGMTMTSEQHALIGSTVRSYLTWLRSESRVEAIIQDNIQYWHAL